MEKTKSKNENVLALVLSYYNYDLSNSTTKIVCPFHKDVNPSLIVDLQRQIWYCFGCGKSGNALDFVKLIEKKYNHKSELESLIIYNKILQNKKLKSKIEKQINVKQYDANNALQESFDYYNCLPNIDWEDYKLNNEQVNARQYLTNRGFKVNVLNEIGCKYNFNNNYEIIIPMYDNQDFKGWVCRTTNKKVEEGGRKYLYNKGFRRSNTLVGNYNEYKTIFVVEGIMDRLKLYQFGFKNSVAILGWKISAKQINKLKEAGVKRVICALDNDKAGKDGYKYLKNFFETYRFQFMKGIKDIGQTNKKQFIKMLKRTKQKYLLKGVKNK